MKVWRIREFAIRKFDTLIFKIKPLKPINYSYNVVSLQWKKKTLEDWRIKIDREEYYRI